MNLYERYLLPPLLTCACSAKPMRYQRKKVVPNATGRVLELGMGPGLNLPFYDAGKIECVIGVDPSQEFEPRAREVAKEVAFPVDYFATTAEDMPLEDASIDTLVITYTLCTIPDAVSALAACKRVLKPGARLLFAEHGVAPDERIAKWQSRLNPFWKAIAGGCNLNRKIPDLIKKAGFEITTLETMYLPSTPRFAGFNYWGEAKAA